ncbi:complex I NDUFA5 subunit family protein, partial [Salmonella sp. s51944]|uniref:complex I NDUFA5 subunit family protein n=1 Tax=Salmonella sp. s51944 TaxID=3159655 RepID=UPI00397F6969
MYTKILSAVQEMPKEAAYREYTEQIVNDRLELLKTEGNVEKIENKLKVGQIEEVIQQAEGELSLARKMSDWRP